MTGEFEHAGVGKSAATPAGDAAEALRDEPERSPIPGMDLNTFRNFLTRAMDGDPMVPPTILSLVNARRGGEGKDEQKERDQSWWERFFWQQALNQSLQAMNDLIDRYNQMADGLRQRIDEQKTKIIENNDWIAEMRRRHEGAASALDYYKENGVFERDEDGKLNNKDAQTLLDEYMRRTGRQPESDTAVAFAIKEQEEFERQEAERRRIENRQRGEEIKTDEKRLKEIEEKVRRAIERRNEIAEEYKTDPARAEREIKKFWQEEGEKDKTLLDKVHGLQATDTLVQRETDNATNNIEQSRRSDDDDLDLSTFKKPNDLARNFNAKVTEPPPAVPVAENAATYAQKRDAVPPGPQNS